MLTRKSEQRTFSSTTTTNLDQQVNDFMNVLEDDLEQTYVASTMPLVISAGGTFYMTVNYSTIQSSTFQGV